MNLGCCRTIPAATCLTALNDPWPYYETSEAIEAQRRDVPLQRDGSIDEMGRAAVYFASSDGDYATGALLRIDVDRGRMCNSGNTTFPCIGNEPGSIAANPNASYNGLPGIVAIISK